VTVPSIRARGYGGATQALLLSGWPTHVLALRNADRDSHGWPRLEYLLSDEARGPGSAPKTELLRFDDTSDPSDSRAPVDAQMDRLLQYGRSLGTDDRLLVLCPGGYGRSTSAAIMIRAARGAPPAAAVADTIADRPQARPNRLMIARADALMKLRGELWRAYADWARLALDLAYEPPVPLEPGRRRRKGLRRRRE
jgi:predicted protein tyrosine phosphatase